MSSPPDLTADSRWLRSVLSQHRYRLLAGVVAITAGVVVYIIATEVFPYHSSNHDEGVYLQQAAMLLKGKLRLTPGSDPLREAFHPWFFVEDEAGFYAKYTPVPAAMFALGKLAGGYRLALGTIAVGNVWLTYAVTAVAFDVRRGVVAAVLLSGAPLFLVTSSVFLPYAPTTLLNLLFLYGYIRTVRDGDRRFAVIAGVAVGLAFFARPYTAVLFALPVVVHTLYRLTQLFPDQPSAVLQYAIIAAIGTGFVGLTLTYNAVLTGSPLVFPYQAFAPLDGLGFGLRRILGHELVYTPELALRANRTVVSTLLTDWFTAGVLGTGFATVGVLIAVVEGYRLDLDQSTPLYDHQLRAILVGITITVIAGNVYFWGNVNILADIADSNDGLISLFGPFYHFDVLLPLAAFGAHGVVTVGEQCRQRGAVHLSRQDLMLGTLLVLIVSVPLVGIAESSVVSEPIERNVAYTDKFEQAYAPFRTTDLSNGLVFVPPEYGEWRNHPFQWLRNDPDFDGPTVYAMDRTPAADFAVIDAYPDRSYYRYRYHGEWTPDADDHVVPILEPVRLVEASTVHATTTVSVPSRITGATISLQTGDTVSRYEFVTEPPTRLSIVWSITPDAVAIEAPNNTRRVDDESRSIDIGGPDEVILTITIREPSGATLTYRESLLVRPTESGVQVLWPPSSSVCVLVTACGLEGTYIPDRPDTRPDGIGMNTTLLDDNS